ncbi:hydrolase [Wenzhouxiangella marina]|uniref:Nicotinamidase-like amidase n=1 Tax=Wenzhouxiangella marina TaxID=1579979 RepID=A0A0K0XZ34_9GAMM|nr:hydrolase [Wenzhouxiangella marina]AKS42948.1 Nicotinamidase-like amidase [Wenzhouxiangella marina]MBB6087368.1 nicotinamidase-related amidase [Wenzhouxiangella marina]
MSIDHPTTDNALLLLVDVQGRLARLMHESEAIIGQCRRLIQACRLLELPVVWAEQLPDKLGPTVPELTEVLDGLAPQSKSSFGCCGDTGLMQAIEASGRSRILLCGIETHVCVWQTAAALRQRDYEVHLIADAVSSRSAFNRDIGLRRMAAAGVHLSNVEMVLFELMGDAGHPKFRDVSKLLK